MANFHCVTSVGNGVYRVTYTKMGMTTDSQAVEIVDYTEEISVADLNSQLNDWTSRKTDADLNITRIQNILTQIEAL